MIIMITYLQFIEIIIWIVDVIMFFLTLKLYIYIFLIIVTGVLCTKLLCAVLCLVSQHAQPAMISTDLCRKSWSCRISSLKHQAR